MRLVAAKGPVSLATTTFNKQLPQRADEFTTTLWNDLVHIVDLLRYMAGGEPVEVTAYQDKFGGEGFDHYTALVRFDNRATGVMFGNPRFRRASAAFGATRRGHWLLHENSQ